MVMIGTQGRLFRSTMFLAQQAFQNQSDSQSSVWIDQPAALTPWQGNSALYAPSQPSYRGNYSHRYFNFLKLAITVSSAGAAGALQFLQYSLDNGANWTTFPGSSIALNPTGGKTAIFEIPEVVRAASNVLTRFAGSGGNGVTDPNSGGACLGFAPLIPSGVSATVCEPVYFYSTTTRLNRDQAIQSAATNTGATQTWTNMPAALTEYLGGVSARINPATAFQKWGAVYMMLNMRIAGFAGSKIMMQYSLNNASTWANIDSETTNTGGAVACDALGFQQGATVKIDKAFQVAGVSPASIIRFVGQDGNGVIDPVFEGSIKFCFFRFLQDW